MKKLVLFLFVAIILPRNMLYSGNKTILDYYRMLPTSLLDDRKYKIFNKNNEYFTNSIVNYEFPITIDIKNGYFYLEDHGTGGGFITQELALFTDNKNNNYLAVNLINGDGVSWTGKCDFYLLKDDKFIKITNKLIPEITLNPFLKKRIDYQYLNNYFSSPYYSFIFSLPRYGTTINVEIKYPWIENYAHQTNSNETLKLKCQEFIDNLKYTRVELIWDMQQSKFIIGKMK